MLRIERGVALGIALCLASCAHAPPPPPPPPPPPAPVVEKPPPPKCEALTEGCVATESSRSAIHPSDWALSPPVGWTYAQESDGAVVMGKEAGLAVTTFAPSGKTDAARDEAFARVQEKLTVTFAKAKKHRWPKKPDQVLSVSDTKVSLYQMDGASRGTKKGPLLVFVAPLPSGSQLLGAGFVPEDDTTDADQAILKAIQSLGRAPDGKAPEAAGAPAP